MTSNHPQDPPAAEQLAALLVEVRQDEKVQADQRREIALLVRQVSSEIDRLAQRNREASSRLRQLEASPESFSRAELQQAYSSSHEAEMRLFMMQNQLEQLRNRQTGIDRSEALLRRLLEAAERLERIGQESAARKSSERQSAAAPVTAASEAALLSIELARRRLSRQLQDSVIQALSDLILRVQIVERLLKIDPEKGKREIEDLRAATAAAITGARRLVHELQPPALEELGLVTAVQRYAEISAASEKLQIDLHVAGKEQALPPAAALAAFRVIQEALANAAQHSGAERVEVALRFGSRQLTATVADEGRGFDVESALSDGLKKPHSGLAEMRLRIELVGGTLQIESGPGIGSSVNLWIPL